METVCQLSYPLNSENASPFGTRTVYLAWPVSCAELVLLPRTATTERASDSTTITTAGILLLFIASPRCLLVASMGLTVRRSLARMAGRVKHYGTVTGRRRLCFSISATTQAALGWSVSTRAGRGSGSDGAGRARRPTCRHGLSRRRTNRRGSERLFHDRTIAVTLTGGDREQRREDVHEQSESVDSGIGDAAGARESHHHACPAERDDVLHYQCWLGKGRRPRRPCRCGQALSDARAGSRSGWQDMARLSRYARRRCRQRARPRRLRPVAERQGHRHRQQSH